jgi:hypothetical protein
VEQRRSRSELGGASRRLDGLRVVVNLADDAGHEGTKVGARLFAPRGGAGIDTVATNQLSDEEQAFVRCRGRDRGGQIGDATAHDLGGPLAAANL